MNTTYVRKLSLGKQAITVNQNLMARIDVLIVATSKLLMNTSIPLLIVLNGKTFHGNVSLHHSVQQTVFRSDISGQQGMEAGEK